MEEQQLDVSDLRGLLTALGPIEALGNLTIHQLKDYCRRFGLSSSGSKHGLIRTLAEFLEDHVLAPARQVPGTASETHGGSGSCAIAPKGTASAAPGTAPEANGGGIALRKRRKVIDVGDGSDSEAAPPAHEPGVRTTPDAGGLLEVVVGDLLPVLAHLDAADVRAMYRAATLQELEGHCRRVGVPAAGARAALRERLEVRVQRARVDLGPPPSEPGRAASPEASQGAVAREAKNRVALAATTPLRRGA